jgi:hypothetical protein
VLGPGDRMKKPRRLCALETATENLAWEIGLAEAAMECGETGVCGIAGTTEAMSARISVPLPDFAKKPSRPEAFSQRR